MSQTSQILDNPKNCSFIDGAFQLVIGAFNSMSRRSFKPEDVTHLYLNKHVLLNAIESCVCDLHRLGTFRDITPDRHKEAAFLIKWIMMLRPIQIHADTADPSRVVLLANEYLAIEVGLMIVLTSANVTAVIREERGYIENLIYLLHYHPCVSPEQFASELYQLERNHLRDSLNLSIKKQN